MLYQLSYLGSGRRYNANRVYGGQGSLVVIVVFLTVTAFCAAAPSSARAQGFDAENAPPLLSPTSYLTLESSGVLPSGALAAGVAVGYMRTPLVLRDEDTNVIRAVAISDRASTFLGGAVGLARRFEIAVRSSASWQRGELGVFGPDGTLLQPAATALGDTTVRVKARLLGGPAVRGLHLAVGLAVGLPTGSPAAFTGDAGVTVRPQALVGWQAARLSLDGFVGYNFRPRYGPPGAGLAIGDELGLGAAIAWTAMADLLWLMAETRLVVGREPGSRGAFPAEVLVGARTIIGDGLVIQAGVGTGLTSGYGSPRLRALASVTYVWGHARPAPSRAQDIPAAPPVEKEPEPTPVAPPEPAPTAPAEPSPAKRPAKEKRRRAPRTPQGGATERATPTPSDTPAKPPKRNGEKNGDKKRSGAQTGKAKSVGKGPRDTGGTGPASP